MLSALHRLTCQFTDPRGAVSAGCLAAFMVFSGHALVACNDDSGPTGGHDAGVDLSGERAIDATGGAGVDSGAALPWDGGDGAKLPDSPISNDSGGAPADAQQDGPGLPDSPLSNDGGPATDARADSAVLLDGSSPNDSQAADGSSSHDSGQAADGGGPVGNGPRVLSLTTNVQTLQPSTSGGLIITAIVTNSPGGSAAIGGVLNDVLGTGSYGAFSSSGSGAYSMTLTWNAIQAVRTDTTGMGGVARAFRAVFYDAAGASTTVDLSVTIACDFASDAICGGTCQSVSSSPSCCGGCSRSCNQLYVTSADNAESVTCKAGKCAVTYVTYHAPVNGDGRCMEKHLTCTGVIATYGIGGGARGPADCATTPASRFNSADIYETVITCAE